MESHNIAGRKRKHSSSFPPAIFTRSKSQIYVHHNRSGRFRRDAASNTHRPLPSAVTDSPRAVHPIPTESSIPTRLDLRRVFSKPLAVVAEQEEKEAVADCEVNPNLEFGEEIRWLRPHGEVDRAGLGGDCVPGEVIEETLDLTAEEGEKLGVLMGDSSPILPNRDQLSDVEDVQTTPPDADVLAAREVGKIRFNGLEIEDNCDVIPPLGIPGVACGVQSSLQIPDKKADFGPRKKLALNQCARLKVFRSPSSVSYRRLLPYLLDIAKDNSCGLEITSCPKFETVMEEKASVKSQASLDHDGQSNVSDSEGKTVKSMLNSASDEMNAESSVEDVVLMTGDSTIQIPSKHTPADSSTEIVCPIADSQNGMISPSYSAQGDNSPKDQVSSAKSISSALVSNSAPLVADVASEALKSCINGDHDRITETSEDEITVFQSISPVTALSSSAPSSVSPSKGILKRNPRGCRGLCTCLNCAAFRLHAEKSFEFSKNQLQDTEEVVLHLMKELSQLRTALEMPHCDSNRQVGYKADQVKEICASASRAEEHAKTRLKEMSEDLFVHCRTKCVQRPRVNFANEPEEKCLEREKPV